MNEKKMEDGGSTINEMSCIENNGKCIENNGNVERSNHQIVKSPYNE